jgi:hypothetical protein
MVFAHINRHFAQLRTGSCAFAALTARQKDLERICVQLPQRYNARFPFGEWFADGFFRVGPPVQRGRRRFI